MPRRSIHAAGYSHAAAIPTASRIGPLLASSVIAPFDVDSRNMPEDAESQVRNLFRHAGAILEAGGATWDDLIKMTFYASSNDLRAVIEQFWLERFPDADARPARHIQVGATSGRLHVQADLLAYIES